MENQRNKNIVFVIGNGFDLNLGRKTSYKDFWNTEYCPKKYPSPLIHHLNSSWSDNLDAVKWYDLENELLEYFRYTTKPEYEDLVTSKEQEFLALWKRNKRDHIDEYEQYATQINSLIDKGIIILDPSWELYMDSPDRDKLIIDRVTRDHKALSLIKDGLCEFLKTEESKAIYKHSVALSALRTVLEAGSRE